jgi:hypothetical protein
MWRSLCGGETQTLVSRDCNTLGVLGATLSIYYDSLIEKCSTLSVVCARTGLTLPFSHLSLACERSELVERTKLLVVSATLEPLSERDPWRWGRMDTALACRGPLHRDTVERQ